MGTRPPYLPHEKSVCKVSQFTQRKSDKSRGQILTELCSATFLTKYKVVGQHRDVQGKILPVMVNFLCQFNWDIWVSPQYLVRYYPRCVWERGCFWMRLAFELVEYSRLSSSPQKLLPLVSLSKTSQLVGRLELLRFSWIYIPELGIPLSWWMVWQF